MALSYRPRLAGDLLAQSVEATKPPLPESVLIIPRLIVRESSRRRG